MEILNHPFLQTIPSQESFSSPVSQFQLDDISINKSSTTTLESYHPIRSHTPEDKTRLLDVSSSRHRYSVESGERIESSQMLSKSHPLIPRPSSYEPSIPSPSKQIHLHQSMSSVSDSIASREQPSSMKNWLSVIKTIQVERSMRKIPPWENSWDNQLQRASALSENVLTSQSIEQSSQNKLAPRVPLLQLNDVSPFYYTSPGHDTLLLTLKKDLIICTPFKDQLNNLRHYRLCIRANRLHRLEVGEISKDMLDELSRISASARASSNSSSIFSIKDYSAMSTQLISSKNITKCYCIYKLPPPLNKAYLRVHRIFDAIKSRVPRIVLYLSVASACKILRKHNDGIARNKIECKCMLMSNGPLPDFHVQWYDQSKLKYSLQSGKLCLSGPHISAYQYTTENTLSWTDIANDQQKSYLLVAQEAMRRCIEENKRKAEENPVVIVDTPAGS